LVVSSGRFEFGRIIVSAGPPRCAAAVGSGGAGCHDEYAAIAGLLAARAGEVEVSNPSKTRAIAAAKIKTDKVDARVLAELLAADYPPSVWQADEATNRLRGQVGQHLAPVHQRTRVKKQVQVPLIPCRASWLSPARE
jgi:hypothetical protein